MDASALAIKCTVFEKGSESASGQHMSGTWGELCSNFEEAGFILDKESKGSVPLLIPAALREGSESKEKGNFTEVSFGALDIDRVTEEVLQELIDTHLKGYSYILYTTWGHAESMQLDGLAKVRVFVPFTRPVLAQEWDLFWPQFNALFGGISDHKCKDISHGYYIPSAPADTPEEFRILDVEADGDVVDVDLILSVFDGDLFELPDEILGRIDLGVDRPAVSKKRIKKLYEKKQRSENGYIIEMGELLEKMSKGEALAEVGGRDDVIYKLAGDLAEAFPDNDAKSLADMFRVSLSVMAEISDTPSNPCPTVKDVFEKIERAQRRILAGKLRKDRKEIKKQQAAGIPTKYTKEYLEKFIQSTGHEATLDEFSDRYIVQSNTTYFLFYGGHYYRRAASEIAVSAAEMLAPAAALHDFMIADKRGGPLKPQDYMSICGTVADEHTLSISQQVSHLYTYRGPREKPIAHFVEAVCPRRIVEGRRHAAVDRWIDSLCEESLGEKMRDWLAVAPDTSKALAAIAFVGPSKVGKTSFAHGVAKIWSPRGAVDMANIVASFNAGITRCPLLLADEELPRKDNGRVPTEKIRSVISAGEHEINAKHEHIKYLQGFYRNVISVNNMDKLSFGGRGGSTTGDDVDAIAQRLLIIPVFQKASDRFDYDAFVTREQLAEHAMWLWQTRSVKPSRFGVETDSYKHLVESDSVVSRLLAWLLKFLAGRELESDAKLPAFVAKRGLFVNIFAVRECWGTYLGKYDEVPTAKALKSAFSVIAATEPEDEARVRNRDGAHRRYRKVRWEHLLNASEDVEYLELQRSIYSEEVLEDSFAKIPKKLHPTDAESAERKAALDRIEQLKQLDQDNILD